MNRLFIVRLDQQRYALPLQDVERVLRMVEITALPEAPSAVLGLINVQGRVVSVIDLRRCFDLPLREVEPEDVLVLVQKAGGMVALAVDGVEGVAEEAEQETVAAGEILPAPSHLEGVVKRSDGLVLICDLDQLLAGRGLAGRSWSPPSSELSSPSSAKLPPLPGEGGGRSAEALAKADGDGAPKPGVSKDEPQQGKRA